jgi:hypothetical protein
MTSPVLALPARLLRTARSLAGRLAVPAKRAAGLIDRAVHRAGPRPPAQVTPDPGPTATTEPAADSEVVSPPAEVVVDPVPLPEPAADLDVEVTLPSELPIPSYDAMNAADAAAAIKQLTDADEVRTVLQFEEENAKRKTVLTAAGTHLATMNNRRGDDAG